MMRRPLHGRSLGGRGLGKSFLTPLGGRAPAWYDAARYQDMAVVADFNNGRFAITTVALGSISGATAAALKVKRACTFQDVFATPASPTYATDNGAQQLRLSTPDTHRFSPVVEAIMARAAMSIVVRGMSDNWASSEYRSIIGLDAAGDPRVIAQEGDDTHAASTAGPTATAGTGGFATGFGVGAAQNASGRSLCFNGGTVATNATAKQSVSKAYLGTTESGPYAGSEYGAGWYDMILLSPDKLADATLQELAMPQSNFT